MIVVANTTDLVSDGIIPSHVASEMQHRARAIMVTLAINSVLCAGSLAATGGLIFWLADALSVAIVGIVMLGAGLAVLARTSVNYSMFGNAAALIGAGLLIGGAAIELSTKYEHIAGWVMLPAGALVAGIAARAWHRGGFTTRFVQGAILLMGVALHLYGLGFLLEQAEIGGFARALAFFYGFAVIALTGWLIDVRLITALAILPFAQMLDTGTGYFGAVYAFWSPESTLSILQMSLLCGLLIWVTGQQPERHARHARVLAILGFVVGNLCALVGSLWGDYVGETLWGPGYAFRYDQAGSYQDWSAARDAFREAALFISADLYSVLWAVALAALVFWAAHRANRGLFNAAMTFGALHVYTQAFESFGDEPLAYVIGGFAAIPLAWGMWRLNERWNDRAPPSGAG